ncbi:MAG: aminotransferase, partial [Solobacterium sp.]|nr:aminotransferase [Solobacterium sp.]
MTSANEEILVHTSPIYPTTEVSFLSMGLIPVRANFNDLEDIKHVLEKHQNIRTALVQYTRQAIDDSYDMEEVLRTIKSVRDIQIITDDNYAVMKVHKIGVELGADLS